MMPREGMALSRNAGTTSEGTTLSVYSIPDAVRCSASLLIDRLRSEGWTIEPPRLKATRKSLKGGVE